MKQILHAGPGLVLGIPTLGRPVPMDWALMLKSLGTPINYNTNFHIVKGREVADARNDIAQFAIDRDAKYLFFLGDDVVPPSHTIKHMIYRMEQDSTIGVIGGVYVNKEDNPSPLVFRTIGQGAYWDWKVGEFFEVFGTGMDCNLIRVDLLKQLKSDWFKTVDKDQYEDNIPAAESWTEDLYFFNRVAKETDYKVYCDGSIICQHWDVYANKAYTLPPDSLPMRRKVSTKTLKLLTVGEKFAINPAESDNFDITEAGPFEQAHFRVQLCKLPFATDSFDWVHVNDPGFNFDLSEYLRVAKPGGKVTVFFNIFLEKEQLLRIYPGSTIQGPYIEIVKVASEV